MGAGDDVAAPAIAGGNQPALTAEIADENQPKTHALDDDPQIFSHILLSWIVVPDCLPASRSSGGSANGRTTYNYPPANPHTSRNSHQRTN